MKRLITALLSSLIFTVWGAETNLYSNPGFEEWNTRDDLPATAWRWVLPRNSRNAFEIFERTDKEKHSGQYSLYLKDSDKSPVNHTLGFNIGEKEAEQLGLGGKILHFSAWVKQIAASRPGIVGISLYAVGSDKKVYTANATVDAAGPTDWGELQTKLKLPEKPVHIIAFLWCANGFNNTGEACFDDIELTAGPVSQAGETPRPPQAIVTEKPETIASGRSYVSFYPAPPSWEYRLWGGFKFQELPGTTKDIQLKILKPTAPWGGISITTGYLDRRYDLSAVPLEQLSICFYLSRNIPVQVGLPETNKIVIKQGVPDEGRFRYQIPMSSFKRKDGQRDVSGISLQFPESLKPGELAISEPGIYTARQAPVPKWSVSRETEAYRKECEQPGQITNDGYTRPEIRNGTWYVNGKPQFYLGPWIYNRNNVDWNQNTNPLNINHIAYQLGPNKKVFDVMGFNSAQISAAHALPGQALFGLPVPVDYRKSEQEFAEYFAGFQNIPLVLDFAFGYHKALKADDPQKHAELDQRNGKWHAFIPFCPEHPEGDRYYRNYFLGGLRTALKNHSNIFVYELFNESSYDCRCRFNVAEFARRMEKKYGTIQNANRIWETVFDSFREIANITDFQQYKKLWPDWCKFSAQRYAEILTKYSDLIRSVDKRENVYYTEQAWGVPPAHTGMDYRLIADALDVLAIEGGWRYGFASNLAARNEMETVVVSGGSSHWFNCDFYQALAKGKKPVINDEHYCTRIEQGIRVPSRKEDMITSLWMELMHGISSNYTYVWDKRSYDWKTYEQAKANVIKPSYKSSSLLNPYNWPVSELKAFKLFEQELEPYKEKILPFPRTKPATVAIFYSYPTLRMSPFLNYKFNKRMESWYASLLHAQIPVRFVFEEELAAGLEENIAALVFPAADYVSPGTLENLKRFRKRGGIVIAEQNAFRYDEYSEPLPVIDDLIRLDGNDASKLPPILIGKGIRRYGSISPADFSEPIRMTDLQIIDRGDFKLIFCVAMGDIASRLAEIKLDLDDSGAFYLYDAVGKRILKNGVHEQWSTADLKRGFQWVLPPQERVLFTLERKRPSGASEISPAEIIAEFQKRREQEKERILQFHKEQARQREAYAQARIWHEVSVSQCHPVDLRKFVNMDFKDDIAGDEKGGWFDQGGNDFANMPLGKQILAGVPFEIIDPAENNGKGVMVLYGTNRKYFPGKISGIPVNEKAAALYFLHTMGWEENEKVLTYKVNYADGTAVEIPIIGGRDIGGWWGATPLPNAKIAVEASNAEKDLVNMQCFRWRNPHPEKEIRTIDIVSAQSGAVPAIAAISRELP